MTDLFSQLLPMSWRGIEFPTANFRVSLNHDLVEHKFVNRDGAHVEATGREPLVFTARALFRNGIRKGKNEKWEAGLYPDGWKRFMVAAADRTTGILQHPELGHISCKLKSAEVAWNAEVRDGVDVDITWVESTDEGLEVLDAITSDSPITDVMVASKDLDASLSFTRDPTPEELKVPGEPSFEDMINDIQSITDQASLLNRRVSGKIEAAQYRATLLVDSVSKAADPKQWPMKQAAIRVVTGMQDVSKRLLVKSAPVIFTTPREMTVGSISLAVQRPIDELINLNPSLVRRPTVRAGTKVRHYAGSSLTSILAPT